MWACFKHRLKFNWAQPKITHFKAREMRKSRKWQETSWLIPCWLVVISWVYLLGRFGVCLCSRSWPGAHGREDSAKSNASLISWPPVKYPFLYCIVWFSYLFPGWESCYNNCFFFTSINWILLLWFVSLHQDTVPSLVLGCAEMHNKAWG